MALMTVYHGGYQAVENPEIRINKNTKDFGVGFYCTVIKEQAQRWARRYNTKIVSLYDVRLSSDLKVLEFKKMTEEWLDFIVHCRNGGKHDFDVVEGFMCDDTIMDNLEDYINGYIDKNSLLDMICLLYTLTLPTTPYV